MFSIHDFGGFHEQKAVSYSLQQRFIDWSLEVANDSGAKYIHATVNPENNHSAQNFIKRGFAVKKTATKYGGLTRNLLEYRVS